MRSDGRARDQLRAITIETGVLPHAEGSTLITLGKTKVLCAATVESDVPRWMRGRGTGWVTAEYAMLPRSTAERTPRESAVGRVGGRTHEIQRLIGRSLRAVTDLVKLGERNVILDCDVLQADGGTRTAAITGAYVALAQALHGLRTQGTLRQWPLPRMVAAVSVGYVGGWPLLDLAYDEDSRAETDMNVVMTDAGTYVEIQGTAEAAPYSRGDLEKMLALADHGIRLLVEEQRRVLEPLGVPLPAAIPA
ncbi:MAG TPA: ribonuclease PH [Candidatus Dormibacteraeota bacterium]|nr:ribonuclease PH [Candidatus Dormibacteraeota bacterium]